MRRSRNAAISILRWLAATLPPLWSLILFALALATCELLAHAIDFSTAGLLAERSDEAYQTRVLLHGPRDVLLAAALAGLGLFRAAALHPLFSKPYAEWLARTPWTSRQPLPLGPVHLVAQDAVVLAVALLFAFDSSRLTVAALLTAFGAPYVLLLSAANFVTNAQTQAYLAAFGLALAVWLGLPSPATLPVLAALYLVALWGLRRSLATFPWQEHWLIRSGRAQLSTSKTAQLGFPFDALSPKSKNDELPLREALLVPALVACWLYAAAARLNDPRDGWFACFMFCSFALTVGAMLRVLRYVLEFHPPINLLGRIATGRLLIPGYDRVFVPSLIALGLVGFQLALLARIDGRFAEMPLAKPIVPCVLLALGGAILLGSPPSLRRWALTGQHRIAAAPKNRTEFVET